MKALTMSAARRRDKVVILTGPSYGASLSTPRVKSLTPYVKLLSHHVKFSTSVLFALVRKLLNALFCDKACGVFCCIGILAMWVFAYLENDHGVGFSCVAMMPWMIAFTIREIKKGVPA